MAAKGNDTRALNTDLQNLSLTHKKSNTSTDAKFSRRPVMDSWEDEDEGSTATDDSDAARQYRQSASKTGADRTSKTTQAVDCPSPPPPTPVSPQTAQASAFSTLDCQATAISSPNSQRSTSGERPEKTTAAAARMISAGLGVRTPKRTEEERRYDKAVASNERKRRDVERERKQKETDDKERAKRQIWED